VTQNFDIKDLYAAFDKVRRTYNIDGCTHCCISEEELADLANGRHKASSAAISSLAHNAMSTVGDEDAFRYFLPRILDEMIKDLDFWHLCADAFTCRIKDAGFDEWTENEKEQTVRALKTIFDKICHNQKLKSLSLAEQQREDQLFFKSPDGGIFEVLDWIEGMVLANFNITEFLNIVDQKEHELLKTALILDHLDAPNWNSDGTITLCVHNLTPQQFKPIKNWSQNSIQLAEKMY